MKLLILLLIVLIGSNTILAQNATFYASKSSFNAGEEMKNTLTTEFKEGDNIYGLVVIDQELKCSCEGSQTCSEGFSTSFMYFPKGDYKSARATWNHTEVSGGKTYVFLDIYPALESAVGRDADDYSKALTSLTVGNKGKITFLSIEGDKCYQNLKIKLKKASVFIERDGSLSEEDIYKNNREAKDYVGKLFDELNDAEHVKRLEERNKEDKLNGKLPEVFYSVNEPSASRSLSADQLSQLIIETKDVVPDGGAYITHRTKELSTKYHNNSGIVDYYTQELYFSYKDKDGNCCYRVVFLHEHAENGEISSAKLSTISSAKAAGGYYYTSSRFFNCENLNK